jgi:hypothetical protein
MGLVAGAVARSNHPANQFSATACPREVMKAPRRVTKAEAQGFLPESEDTLQQKPASETTKDAKKENWEYKIE